MNRHELDLRARAKSEDFEEENASEIHPNKIALTLQP